MASEYFIKAHLIGLSYNEAKEGNYNEEIVYPKLLEACKKFHPQMKYGDIVRMHPVEPGNRSCIGKLLYNGESFIEMDYRYYDHGTLPQEIKFGGKNMVLPESWSSITDSTLIRPDLEFATRIYQRKIEYSEYPGSTRKAWNCEISIGGNKYRIIYVPSTDKRYVECYIDNLYNFLESPWFYVPPEDYKDANLWKYSKSVYITKIVDQKKGRNGSKDKNKKK